MKILKGKRLMKPKLLFYGEPGAGKSTAASEFASPFFIGNEVPLHLEAGDKVQTNKLAEFREPLEYLLKGDHKYKTLVIDSLDGWQDLFRNELCHSDTYISPNKYDKGYGAWWNELRGKYVALRSNYLEPLGEKMSIISISHQKRVEQEGVDKPYQYYQPNLENKLLDEVINYVDGIFYFMKDHITRRIGEDIVNKNAYKIYTNGSKHWMAKNRWDLQEFYQYDRDKTVARIRQDIGDYYKGVK